MSRAIDPSDRYTHYNNYVIYRQSFAHLVGQQELHPLYLGEHWDYFRYSPSFALAFGVFAWLPDLGRPAALELPQRVRVVPCLEDAASP